MKLWKQACLPSLLFGTELWTLTPTFLLKLERCQDWFLKHIFYVPELAPGSLLLKHSGLNSIESEVTTKKLLFSGRLITEHKMTPLIKDLFDSGTKSFFDSDISSLCLSQFQLGTSLPRATPGISSKTLPGGSGFDF